MSIANDQRSNTLNYILAAVFFAVSVTFVWRSFYRMRIDVTEA